MHDDVADLIANLVHREFTIGADNFAQEHGGIRYFDSIGAKRTNSCRAKFGVAQHDRVFRAPFQVGKTGRVDVIHLGFERALKSVIPMVQRRQDRHVVGFQHIQTRCEHIGKLAFVDENSGLPFTHGQLGAVFNLVGFAFKPPNHCVVGVVGPVDDVDELTG